MNDKAGPWPRGPCGKLVYSSEQAAKDASVHAGFRIRIYWCDECEAWHTTNNSKSGGERGHKRKHKSARRAKQRSDRHKSKQRARDWGLGEEKDSGRRGRTEQEPG